MSLTDGSAPPSREQIAWQLVEIFEELSPERTNELLAKNVPMETLEFISTYAEDFGEAAGFEPEARRSLPNLLLLGYLLRVVEDRLLGDEAQ